MEIKHFDTDAREPTTGLPIEVMTKVFGKLGKLGRHTTDQFPDALVVVDSGETADDFTQGTSFKIGRALVIALDRSQCAAVTHRRGEALWVAVDDVGRFQHSMAGPVRTAVARPADTDIAAAVDWLSTGQRGRSSEALCATLVDVSAYLKIPADEPLAYPHDAADFGRCVAFLDAVPGARQRLPQMAERSTIWSHLVDNWGEIEEAHRRSDGAAVREMLNDIRSYEDISEEMAPS